MATTKINTGKVIDASAKASSAHSTTTNVGLAVSSIRRRVDGSILARNGVAGSFTTAQNTISGLARDIAKIYQMANSAASQYDSTETGILNEGRRIGLIAEVADTNGQTSENKALYESLFDEKELHLIKSGMSVEEYLAERGITSSQLEELSCLEGTKEEKEKAIMSILKITKKEKDGIFGKASLEQVMMAFASKKGEVEFLKVTDKMETDLKFSSDIDAIREKMGKEKWDLKEKLKDKGYRDDDDRNVYYNDGTSNYDGERDDAKKLYEKKATLAEINAEKSSSLSLIEGKWVINSGGTVSAKVGNVEGHASISAGFYVMGDDGESMFCPGINAEIGASVTAIEVEIEQQVIGNDMLGVNVEGTATAGKAEAKAEAGAQIFNTDGDLDMQLGASLSAEAIAGEIEGKAAVNILGGEVGVKGGLNFGVGAHADIGFNDGVFRMDVGASFGVGASVGLEVDIGGMANTVVDGAVALWDTAAGWFD